MRALAVSAGALVTAIACANSSLAAAGPSPPAAGVLYPGVRLAHLRLGMTPAQVRATWGSDFGRCRNCGHPTWYYNYAPFTPQGAGVEFRKGRVAAVFTLRSPAGWETSKGLRVGDAVSRVTALYGVLPQSHCTGYDASMILAPKSVSTIYVQDEKVIGFGLSRVGVPVCR